MSRVWPVRRSFLTESTVVSVSIREIAYTVSQETIHGFQQICCRRANNYHYCESNEWTKPCSKLTRPLQPWFSSIVHVGVFCWRYNSVPLIQRLSVTPYTTCLFVKHIYGLFCAHIYAHLYPQKNARLSCSRNDCKYTWENTAHISCHNFETNGRPYARPRSPQRLLFLRPGYTVYLGFFTASSASFNISCN